jgi:hypothetical protein
MGRNGQNLSRATVSLRQKKNLNVLGGENVRCGDHSVWGVLVALPSLLPLLLPTTRLEYITL